MTNDVIDALFRYNGKNVKNTQIYIKYIMLFIKIYEHKYLKKLCFIEIRIFSSNLKLPKNNTVIILLASQMMLKFGR